ncbi:MAG: nitroreductase family deazaflavin-dependent oxidoreductase [Chloroflexota bacterium]|nr:nitroreductase family deazaflavin-dependent oxidoreductase [Chloroflexota bacterium]
MTDHPLWLRTFWQIHRVMDRLSGGRLGTKPFGIPALWLTTVGRKTGNSRTNSLYYLEDGPNLVVVASNAGLNADPSWWLNLQANPETEARTGSRVRSVRARAATADERERLWPRLVRLNPDYAKYQAATSRPISVVILEPRIAR